MHIFRATDKKPKWHFLKEGDYICGIWFLSRKVLGCPEILRIFNRCPGLSWKVNFSENCFINKGYHHNIAFYSLKMHYVSKCNLIKFVYWL